MNSYAIFVAATENYLPYLNALLNSIEKRGLHDGCELTVYVMHCDFDPAWDYCERALRAFSFGVVGVELLREGVPHPPETTRLEFVKRARYFKTLELARQHDVACLMDADMFLVSSGFRNLFDLVRGTRLLIGCNERYKWNTSKYHWPDGSPVVPRDVRMFNMICNVPTLFDMNQWSEVFSYYTKIAFTGQQTEDGKECPIGDLFAHNLSIYANGREGDVVALPMEAMTQVHHTWRRPWTHIIVEDGHWRTFSGERAYSIHGRIADPQFVPRQMAAFREEYSGHRESLQAERSIECGLRAIQAEWYDLNYNGAMPVTEFIPSNAEWEKMKR